MKSPAVIAQGFLGPLLFPHRTVCTENRGGHFPFHFNSPLTAEIAISQYRDPHLKAERKVKCPVLSLFECSVISSSEGPDFIVMALLSIRGGGSVQIQHQGRQGPKRS